MNYRGCFNRLLKRIRRRLSPPHHRTPLVLCLNRSLIMNLVKKVLLPVIAVSALSMTPDREAEATQLVVGCFSGSTPGVSLIPTIWCSLVWSPGGPFSIATRFNATAVRLVDGATASGSKRPITIVGSGSERIIVTCSNIPSAATMNATAIRLVFGGAFGLIPAGSPVQNSVVGAVGSTGPQSCLPVL